MRILNLVHQYLPEFVGGTELYTQALTQALNRRGWQTAIFHRSYRDAATLTVGREGDTEIYAAAARTLSPTRRFLATWRQPTLHAHWLAALDTFQPDLVHVQHLMGLPASLIQALEARGIPYVVTLLDYWWVCANANLLTNYDQQPCDGPRAYLNCTHCAVARQGTVAAWGAAPMLWGLLAHRRQKLHGLLADASALLAASNFVRDWYAEHGTPTARLRTTRWGVIPPAKMPVRRAEKSASLALLYVGGLAPNKGVHTVLEALRGMNGGMTGRVHLSIAGDERSHPGYAAHLRELAAGVEDALGEGQVTFLGRLNREEVWHTLAQADAVVIPSLWHETFCLVAYEALTVGVPVLASDMGALSEAVQDGVNGMLIAPGDVAAWRAAIQTLIDHPQRLNARRAGVVAPRRFAEHVDEIESVYGGLLPTVPREL